MFGYSWLHIIFMINSLYTIILFLFFHQQVTGKIVDNYKEMKEKDLTKDEIDYSTCIFYLLSILTGTLRLIGDIICLLICRKKCIWFYEREDKKDG